MGIAIGSGAMTHPAWAGDAWLVGSTTTDVGKMLGDLGREAMVATGLDIKREKGKLAMLKAPDSLGHGVRADSLQEPCRVSVVQEGDCPPTSLRVPIQGVPAADTE